MPRRPTRSVPVLFVHGWQGSEEGHWQRWLAEALRADGRDVHVPDLPDPEHPVLADWLAALDEALSPLPDGGFDLLAHSLGAVLWLHHASRATDLPRPDRALLVAPPSPSTALPELAGFFPPPLDIDAVRRAAEGTVLVSGDDDPYTPEGPGAAYGLPLRIATTIVPGGGHLNSESGYGEWPAALDWCRRDNLAFY